MILHYSSYSGERLDNLIFPHIVASVMAVKITSGNTGLVTLGTGDPEMDFYILFFGLSSGFRFGPFMVYVLDPARGEQQGYNPSHLP